MRIFLLLVVMLTGLTAVFLLPPMPPTPPPAAYLVYAAGDLVQAAETSLPEPLLPKFDWFTWYETTSGFAADETHFGAYVSLAVGDTLLLGFGSARPAEIDGALIAAFDGTAVISLGTLPEQGVHEMAAGQTAQPTIVHIAGTDPALGDGWEAGNHYTTTAVGPITKHRDAVNGLVNVIHTWGLWLDEVDTVYAAVGAHEYQTIWHGQVWRSADLGESWEFLSNLGNYRVYDIIGFANRLYAHYSDDSQAERNTLAVSPNGGFNWTDIIEDDVSRIHMVIWHGLLTAVNHNRTAVYTLDTTGQISQYPLPAGVKIGVSYEDVPSYSNYKSMAVVGDDLYAVLESQETPPQYHIAHTHDLQTWEIVASSPHPILSLGYWPAKHWLIWGEGGHAGQVWQLALPPPTYNNYLPFCSQTAVGVRSLIFNCAPGPGAAGMPLLNEPYPPRLE